MRNILQILLEIYCNEVYIANIARNFIAMRYILQILLEIYCNEVYIANIARNLLQ